MANSFASYDSSNLRGQVNAQPERLPAATFSNIEEDSPRKAVDLALAGKLKIMGREVGHGTTTLFGTGHGERQGAQEMSSAPPASGISELSTGGGKERPEELRGAHHRGEFYPCDEADRNKLCIRSSTFIAAIPSEAGCILHRQ